jgi:hypothetical protein
MVAIPVAILALAAGIYLLIYVKQAGLGTLYKLLAWKVIGLSLIFIVAAAVIGVHHMRHMHQCHASGHCDMRHGDGGCPYMTHGSCGMQGGSQPECCKPNAACCGEKKECCSGTEMKACCKDMKGGPASCSEMSGGKAKPACCAKDSAAKK